MSIHPSAALAQATDWEVATSPFGLGEWLMAAIPHGWLAVVPPAVPAGPDEQPDDRDHWRVATWTGEELNEPELEPYPVDLVAIVEHVDGAHREWVAAVGDRQLRHLDLMARLEVGSNPDQRAHAASVRREALLAEFALAFPERVGSGSAEPLPGGTGAAPQAFHHQIGEPAVSRADAAWEVLEGILERVFYAVVWCYRRLLIGQRAAARHAQRLRHSGPRTPTPPASAAPASRQETGQLPALVQ